MTVTQHVRTLKTQFLHYITIKMVLVIFHNQNNFKQNACLVHLCYLVATSSSSKLQFFQRWREWEYMQHTHAAPGKKMRGNVF
jgi:hypothetical protein